MNIFDKPCDKTECVNFCGRYKNGCRALTERLKEEPCPFYKSKEQYIEQLKLIYGRKEK